VFAAQRLILSALQAQRSRWDGRTDTIGQPHRKELVSGERAKAVAAYVTRTLNLPAAKVRPQAMSDRELLVTNCPVKPVAQRDACNAPNRRVELVVTGRR